MDLTTLKNILDQDQPDLKTLYSESSLNNATDVLVWLLNQEKQYFQTICTTELKNITFDMMYEYSYLRTYYVLISHYNSVAKTSQTQAIVDEFLPQYVAFGNEVQYSRDWYDRLKYLQQSGTLNEEQQRIVNMDVQHFDIRWIGLPEDVQEEIKIISQRTSKLWEKFKENSTNATWAYTFHITDRASIETMPQMQKQVAFERAQKQWLAWYLFDWSYSSHSAIMKYCSDRDLR